MTGSRACGWVLVGALIVAPAPGATGAETSEDAGGANYQLPVAVIDGGGGAAGSTNFDVRASIGRGYAGGGASSPGFGLNAGFIATASGLEIFADGFESGDTAAWSGVTP